MGTRTGFCQSAPRAADRQTDRGSPLTGGEGRAPLHHLDARGRSEPRAGELSWLGLLKKCTTKKITATINRVDEAAGNVERQKSRAQHQAITNSVETLKSFYVQNLEHGPSMSFSVEPIRSPVGCGGGWAKVGTVRFVAFYVARTAIQMVPSLLYADDIQPGAVSGRNLRLDKPG